MIVFEAASYSKYLFFQLRMAPLCPLLYKNISAGRDVMMPTAPVTARRAAAVLRTRRRSYESFYIPPKLGVEREGEEEEHNLNPVGCAPCGDWIRAVKWEKLKFSIYLLQPLFIYLLQYEHHYLSTPLAWPSHHIDAQVLHYSPSE